jgi:S1-C subfamily serine protease
MRRAGLVAAFILGLTARAGADEISPRASEFQRLLALETAAVELIEAAKPSFVFIEGGSGFLVSADGHILTNDHVVAGKSELVVQFTGGKSYRAEVTGHDPEGDVALLKIRHSGDFPHRDSRGQIVKPLELGDSDSLRIGEQVVALGDPFLVGSKNLFLEVAPPEYEPSASLGVVSALHRFSDMYTDAIQVDVAVNRGNSGGPLLTLDGKVVGINGKIETRFDIGVNTGVGYAVPSNQIRRFLPLLEKAGGKNVRHGSIHGIELDERGSEGGLLVRRVRPGSPADAAGIDDRDRIVSIDGQPVFSRNRYFGVLGTYPADHEVKVVIERGGVFLEVPVKLLEAGSSAHLGLKTETQEAGGLKVIEVVPGSAADRAGLEVGDAILFVDGKKVEATEDLRARIRARSPGDEVSLAILRNGETKEFKVRLGGRRD